VDDLDPIAGYSCKREMLNAVYTQEGLSIKTISNRIGVSTAAVERWMRLLGIPRRGRGGDNTKAEIGWRLHRIDPRVVHGLSIRDLARLVSASESYVWKFRKAVMQVWNSRLSVQ